jgi:hypothetical protein
MRAQIVGTAPRVAFSKPILFSINRSGEAAEKQKGLKRVFLMSELDLIDFKRVVYDNCGTFVFEQNQIDDTNGGDMNDGLAHLNTSFV